MTIEKKDNEIIVRLPGDTDIEELKDLLDWLKFREITKKSKALQEDVDKLAKEAKKGRWKKTVLMLRK
ncbi:MULTISPECIES: hypothetical protein [unclassified Imperialibacter]|uniref:hypothetical protein n=1 Tax=unclassified Imperialibacter TaxID=2629706 RepID=UPI001258EBCB|nr:MULTISPECIES: hypothetical protein [unclassified Imperialibacter]CAD5254449.1 conserved hypothetical protein [Imperialibacter sp. 89]CAD5267347.1 conserved hypothetical protein [Imperialibacter sp. 75]VVT00897.1 conserved hypothetical protein [Imperialibacter sp. EC-SDR9]